MLETRYTLYQDSVKVKLRPFRTETTSQKRYLLTNSKDNSYLVILAEKDSLHYNLKFKEQNRIKADIVLLKTEFENANRIKIPCRYILSNKNHFQYQVKNYEFKKLKDTVIGSSKFQQIALESINKKRRKRKKLGILYYLIDTTNHTGNLPIIENPTAYEEWKINTTLLPKGILHEVYFKDYYGYIDSKETVIDFELIDKKIIINDECF